MTKVLDHIMYLDSQDMIISKNLANQKGHELNEVALIKRILKEGDMALDIGAHIGYFTLIMARYIGETGKVFAFEPSPTNFKLLKKNIKLNGYKNVALIPMAISNKKEKVTLYLSPRNSGNHSLFKIKGHKKSINVNTLSLDDYFEKADFNIDFAKIDTEGAEFLVIEGMSSILKKTHGIKLIIEFYPRLLKTGGFKPRDFLNMLKSFDLKLYFIKKDCLQEFSEISDKYMNHPTWHRNIYCERIDA